MKRTISIVFFLCTIIASTFGQLTIEDIWKHYTYYPFGISKVFHSNTGTSMYIVESNKVLQIPYSKQKITTILDANGRIPHEIYSIQFSPSEDIMLAATNIEMIRRNSYSAQYYVYHISTDSLHLLLSDSIRIQNPTFSPANNTICYFYNNNLYITNGIDSPHAITNDGAYNKIINGMPDWVSEEEFDIQQAFAWSPQGMHIAYIQWDESTVPEYTIPKYGSTYPELFTYKYPKAGEEPAQVRAKIYSVQTQKTSTIQFPCTYTYIPEFSWIDSNRIAFTLLNRLQNKVEIAVYSLLDNSCKIVYTYTSKTYVDIPTYFTHIEGTNSFIICNDSDGYNNLYIFTYESGFAKKITQNLGDITDVYGYFKESNTIMFQATNNNPLERYVFELNLQTGVLHCLSDEPGTHTLDVNSLGTGWIREYSNKNPMVTVYIEGKNLEQNREPFANYWMQDVAKNMKFSTVEFFTIPTQDNEKLNAYIMKPHKFRKTKQYPVVVMVYGGPGMQKVTNEWNYDFYWNQYLTQHGYIVVAVDCRGTDGRGSNFRKQTYLNLGEKESYDFAATAQYLRTLPYVDKQNITIQGWSYGAYMALLTAAKYPDSYNSVIAIAPVTKWELYDNIYTERYMQTPTLNPEGYKNSSVFTYIQNIKAPILLAHGTADDNVHIQNTYELISELIKNEKDFETLIFPNDEHSLFGKNSRIYLYSKYIDFLDNHSKSNK